MTSKTFSIKKAFSDSWALEKAELSKFILVAVVLLGVSLVSGLAEDQSWILTLLSYFLQVYLGIIWIIFAVRSVESKKLVFKSVFNEINANLYFKFFVLTVLVTILVGLGTILLIIPGIIAATGLQFAGYFMIDENVSIKKSMKLSWEATKGVRLKLFWLIIVLGLVNILGMLLFGIGLLVTMPLTSLVLAHIYVDFIKHRKISNSQTSSS